MMWRKKPKHITLVEDRHGKIRCRFRKGRLSAYINEDLGTPAWWEAYHALLKGDADKDALKSKSGTMCALIEIYYRSPEYRNLADSTKANYRGILDRFKEEHGHRTVAGMQRKHVKSILNKKAHTPNAANNLLKKLKIIMRLALDLEIRSDDPTLCVKMLKVKSSGHHSWTDEEIKAYEDKHPKGSKARLALYLMLYLAQRRSDVVKLGRQHMKDGLIRVCQQKTGVELWLPIHPVLKEELNRVSGQMTFLVTEHGKPHSAKGFGNVMRKWCDDAGLKQCSSHGLRKAAASRLADAGCTEEEIKSVTGHTTSSEVNRYTKGANQRKLSESAFRKLSNLST